MELTRGLGEKNISLYFYYELRVSTNTIKGRFVPTELNLPPTKSVFAALLLVSSIGILIALIFVLDKMFLVKANAFLFLSYICLRKRKEMADGHLLQGKASVSCLILFLKASFLHRVNSVAEVIQFKHFVLFFFNLQSSFFIPLVFMKQWHQRPCRAPPAQVARRKKNKLNHSFLATGILYLLIDWFRAVFFFFFFPIFKCFCKTV